MRCVLDLERCFGTFWTDREDKDASFIFKRLAFQNSDCGDCRMSPSSTSTWLMDVQSLMLWSLRPEPWGFLHSCHREIACIKCQATFRRTCRSRPRHTFP